MILYLLLGFILLFFSFFGKKSKVIFILLLLALVLISSIRAYSVGFDTSIYLNEYTYAKNMELKSLEKSLQNNNEFYKNLYSTLERVAEIGGYSMILSLQQNNAILWYSSSVDVTDEVISRLGISGE